MSPVFVDSFYFFAILNQKDLAHPKAMEYSACHHELGLDGTRRWSGTLDPT